MTISNLVNKNGNKAVNQFIIKAGDKETFQSYETTICVVENGKIVLDIGALSYSKTTSKHLYIFLGMDRKQIEKGIASGEIAVKDLN